MDAVLFCPFCGEAFEGKTHCPDHDLPLRPWAELPKSQRPAQEERALPWYSLRAGRGFVVAGAAMIFIAFLALPVGRVDGDLRMGGSMLALALASAPRLWLIPAAAAAELTILYRRRMLSSMRGARVAVILVACVPTLAVFWAWLSARRAVALLAEYTQKELHLHFGAGAYLVWLATLLLLKGGLCLGVETESAAHAAGEH